MKEQFSNRVLEIDFFRFLFSVVILFRHAKSLRGENLVFPGGAFGVEFFFLVSGYLMMATLEKMRSRKIENLGKETVDYLKRKVSSIYPEVLLAFAIGFFVKVALQQLSWAKTQKMLTDSIFEVLLIQMAGLGANRVNSVIWYVQAMLLCMAILYPLIRKYPEIMRRLILPLGGVLLLGYLQQNFKHFRTPDKWLGLAYKGNVRAMAELCLGAECYFAAQYLRNLNLTKLAKRLLTAAKWLCWALVFWYMSFPEWKYDPQMLLVMWIAVVLAFSHQCVDVPLFQHRIVAFLGKFSLPLYLSHFFYAHTLGKILPASLRYRYVLLCYVAISFLTAIIVMYGAKAIRKNTPSLKAAISRCFLVK